MVIETLSISSAAKNIEQLLSLPTDELKQLIDEYPYVPIYKVALAKKYKDDGHAEFREALTQAALQSPDRISLYEFLHHVEESKDILTQSTATKEAETRDEVDIKTDQLVKDVEIKAVTEEPEIELPIEANLEEADVAGTFESIPDEIQSASVEEDLVIEKVYPEPEEEDASDKLQQLRQLALEQEAEKRQLNEDLLKIAAERKVNLEEKHSFLEWLDILQGSPLSRERTKSEIEQAELDEVNELEDQIDEYTTSQIYVAEIQREAMEIEDKEEEIQLAVKDSKAVKELADKSLALNTGVVTETLAKLMLMQGKKSESIALYEQLRLKYPEKSDYFAAQIDAIKAS